MSSETSWFVFVWNLQERNTALGGVAIIHNTVFILTVYVAWMTDLVTHSMDIDNLICTS